MSLDIWLSIEVDAGGKEPHRVDLFDANITHNLHEMWRAAGVEDALYESEGKLAGEILPVLKEGLAKMQKDPAEYKKYDSPNGWGLYIHAVPWLKRLVNACEEYPKAKIGISR